MAGESEAGERLNIAILEPYYGGSHKQFVDTLFAASSHRFVLATMPARKWKWRMRGAAMWFAHDETAWQHETDMEGGLDAILCNDMLSVADLKALLPSKLAALPIICYFHENQLTYPLLIEEDRDYQYGMTNITSCLAADEIWFNSQFHLQEFTASVESLLRKMPDCVPRGVIDKIRAKSMVVSPPLSLQSNSSTNATTAKKHLTILWPHRWEYDKNPEAFLKAMIQLDQAGLEFEIVLVGEQFRTAPRAFAQLEQALSRHITHKGYVPSRQDYLSILSTCDVVISTAIQENFGIAVAEAIAMGCFPLLPNRLAYPELIPDSLHKQCLYENDAQLVARIQELISQPEAIRQTTCAQLRKSIHDRFGSESAIPRIDHELSRAAKRGAFSEE